MEQTSSPSRRDFLKLSANFLLGLGGLLGLAGLIRYFSYAEPPMPRQFDLGAAANFPVGSRTLRAEIPAVIHNRGGKFEALSLTCTHLGCTVEEDGNGFMCPCHGSRYDSDGAPVQGPAQKRLPRLRVEILADQTLRLFMD